MSSDRTAELAVAEEEVVAGAPRLNESPGLEGIEVAFGWPGWLRMSS